MDENNIDRLIGYYDVNTRCFIKHKIFLNKKLKSVKKNSDKVSVEETINCLA